MKDLPSAHDPRIAAPEPGWVDLAEDVDPGDVAAAINGLRAIYDFVVTELEAP